MFSWYLRCCVAPQKSQTRPSNCSSSFLIHQEPWHQICCGWKAMTYPRKQGQIQRSSVNIFLREDWFVQQHAKVQVLKLNLSGFVEDVPCPNSCVITVFPRPLLPGPESQANIELHRRSMFRQVAARSYPPLTLASSCMVEPVMTCLRRHLLLSNSTKLTKYICFGVLSF